MTLPVATCEHDTLPALDAADRQNAARPGAALPWHPTLPKGRGES
jgi:hypothetical protein